MTFLEWLLAELIGEPPIVSRGNGESTWDCPSCGRAKFHTFPLRPPYKHRAKCWVCDFRGDAVDMLQAIRPVEGESYPQALRRINKLRRKYELEIKNGETITLRGNGATHVERRDDPRNVDNAWDDFRNTLHDCEIGEPAALSILLHARDAAQKNKVRIESIIERWISFIEFVNISTLEHAKTCTREDCGDLCRAIRGLPPLNKGKEYQQEYQQKKKAMQERAKRACRGCKPKGKPSERGKHKSGQGKHKSTTLPSPKSLNARIPTKRPKSPR